MKCFQKAKRFIEDHAVESIIVVNSIGMLTVGYIIGTSLMDKRATFSIHEWHKAGFFRFFDPTTNTEISEEQCMKLVKGYFKK